MLQKGGAVIHEELHRSHDKLVDFRLVRLARAHYFLRSARYNSQLGYPKVFGESGESVRIIDIVLGYYHLPGYFHPF